ncbi:MAG TPA: hypothetical protein VFV98_18690 [Vicinamibacterales bacterium]|nr:hypothetical protein [Vicinamibacterales bacterium]
MRRAGFVVLFLVLLPAVTTRLYASDEVQFFAWLRSWAFDRDVNFDNEYRHFNATGRYRGFAETFLSDERVTEIGRRPNFAPVGSAILWAPFYAVGHAVAIATGAPRDGYSKPYVAAVAYGSAYYGFMAALISGAIAVRVVGRGGGATLAVWFGTPLVFYMYIAPGFGHATSAFAVALFIWTWLQVRDAWSPAGAFALGAAGALMAMVREQDALLIAGPAIDFLRTAARHRRQSLADRPGIATPIVTAVTAGSVAFLVCYAPQLAAYKALNGHFGQTYLVTRKMNWAAPHFFDVLISREYGLFFWTPLVVVALAGLMALALRRVPALHRDAAWIGALALVMFALQVYTSGSVESWTVAGSFGQRRFVATTPLLVLGLAAIFVAAARWWAIARWGLGVLVVLCVWWNAGLMAQFGLHTMDRQRLTLAENARETFITLPMRAPALAWRYFTNRSSFYQLPLRDRAR